MPQANDWQPLLGLAKRAGKVVSGEDTVLRSIREQKAKLVLLAEDASDRTKKTITNKCTFYRVPLIQVPDRFALGKAIGQPARVIVAIVDSHFAGGLIGRLESSIRG
ncbi:YlxQ family RNA-binding protein [Sporolactobacillus spathodeae]|uniref:Ribosomal protein L7Ae-like RNA K-turn-binding protein n=1 Tax=Sporolactobacillus spathodeae TaxID=1465502 RepID=A0ABS2Q5C9_9BACL|nr:YlxQ family RNA-binding protein [Sporolactobacillus spathodeae]MBM7656987.1 ribosomal protein L7Ae-like RNA K-turn-binding protein [Sporolactobacillus spathodeae]